MSWPLEAEDSLGFFSFLSSKPTKWVKSVPSEWAVSHDAHARRGLWRTQNDLRSPFSKLKAETWKSEKVPAPPHQSIHASLSLGAHRFPCAPSWHQPLSLYLGANLPTCPPSQNLPWKWPVAYTTSWGGNFGCTEIHPDVRRSNAENVISLWRARICFQSEDRYSCSSCDPPTNKVWIMVNLNVLKFSDEKQEGSQLQTHMKAKGPYSACL